MGAGVAALVAGLGSLLAGVGSVVSAFTAKTPRISIPTFKIPEEDLRLLTQQVQANVALSDEARRAVIEALENYNMGRLSPTYEALFNQYEQELRRRLNQELAARGFTPGSSEYNRMMMLLETDLAAYRAQLLRTQLEDALRVAGLTDTAINDLIQKWETMGKVTEGQIAAQLGALGLQQTAGQMEQARWGAISSGIADLFGGASQILSGATKKETSPTTQTTLRDYLSSLGYTLSPEIPQIFVQPLEKKEERL